MLDALLVAATLVTAAAPVGSPADTVVALQRGDRIILENLEGEITVRAWEQNDLEIRGEEDELPLRVRRTGSTIRITHDDRKGRRRGLEAEVRLPAWVDLEVGGRSVDVWIDGIDGRVEVNGVSGDVWIENVGGAVQVRTIEGEVDVSRARGGVDASSQSDEVRLRDVQGPVNAHSGSGDLTLVDIRSSVVRAETQDGDITFSGTIDDAGDYRFFVHDGDASIAIPSSTNARVAVSTFDGDFESDFPVRIERFTGGREFDFTIGNGAAHIEIQVFDGEIRLLERR